MPGMEPYDAVVIGAGQAGLSASYHLRRRGIDHVVLDADDAPGRRLAAPLGLAHDGRRARRRLAPGRRTPGQGRLAAPTSPSPPTSPSTRTRTTCRCSDRSGSTVSSRSPTACSWSARVTGRGARAPSSTPPAPGRSRSCRATPAWRRSAASSSTPVTTRAPSTSAADAPSSSAREPRPCSTSARSPRSPTPCGSPAASRSGAPASSTPSSGGRRWRWWPTASAAGCPRPASSASPGCACDPRSRRPRGSTRTRGDPCSPPSSPTASAGPTARSSPRT